MLLPFHKLWRAPGTCQMVKVTHKKLFIIQKPINVIV
jgi:hypothetical protein